MRAGRVLAFAAAGLLGLLVLFAALNRRDQDAARGEEIRYDDFGFSLLDHRRSAVPSAAGKVLLLVDLRVSNHAKRVPFRFDPATVRLLGGDGREFQAVSASRPDLPPGRDPFERALPPGGSCVAELGFDVPSDLREPRLRISFGRNGFLDLLDDVFWGRKRIRLEG
ncbi:MAG TPA: hypothetical protein VFI25_07040 [Planctomycetota bacterium]|jgi:hypothetical protein|nr:hypothetical protein [Planctomycetota bacterium]